MQILPNIYKIQGNEFGRFHNSYMVSDKGATIMIDSGDMSNFPVAIRDLPSLNLLPEVERNMAVWGFRLADVSHCFITHEHLDHASHAAELQRRGIKIVASPETAEALAVADNRVIGWAHGREGEIEPCVVDIVLKDGEELTVGGLTVRGIAVPGHSPGSMIFDVVVNEQRSWFIGDMYKTVGPSHMTVDFPWMGDVASDKAKYTESTEKLLNVKDRPDHVFPGHGPAAIGCGWLTVGLIFRRAMTEWRNGRNQR